MKLCNDCKWPEHRNALGEVHENSICNHPKSQVITINQVTGRESRAWRACKEMRLHGPVSDDLQCGPSAQFFEPRDVA